MNKKINYANLFFITVIVVGSIVFFMLCLQLINKNKNKHEEMITTTKSIFKESSKNVGIYKSFYNPAHVGETVIATFYDEKNNKYTDVDITGIRYLSDEEVKEYADSTLKEGFSWYGFEYKIKFNDLNYLNESINPVIKTAIYNEIGYNLLTFNGHNYVPEVKVIYDNHLIKNGESASIKIIYQYPTTKDHEICFGYDDKKLSCFSK
ncbi:hypothetical protein EGP95_00465 [bacterium]|nr:hypothetical protein [bacterium]